MKEKLAASLIIHGAEELGSKGRKEIADWLQSQANGIIMDGHNYAKKFTARYFLISKKRYKMAGLGGHEVQECSN